MPDVTPTVARHAASSTPGDLAELIDFPREVLSCEYKSALDFSSPRHKADLARHIAAIANHGGGYIVFGFNDDMTPSKPEDGVDPDRDIIAGVVRKYLEPPIHCDVFHQVSSAGRRHAIIVVPPHGAVPICARANGPLDDKGKPIGIVQGVFYMRKPGPESSPIISAAEWQPIIRRCAMHDRAAIMSLLAGTLASDNGSPLKPGPTPSESLLRWHDATRMAFLARIAQFGPTDPMLKALKQFSYLIERDDDQRVNLADFKEVLRQLNLEVRDRVHTGWSMFFTFDNRNFLEWQADPSGGDGDEDFLQMSLADQPDTLGRDFWRISSSGKASLIRDFWEDQNGSPFSPGSVLDPDLMTRELAEIVRHADAFARRFETPTRVHFRCEWHGLAGRHLSTFRGGYFSPRPEVKTDVRTSTGSWPLAVISGQWSSVVAELAGPVARTFDIEERFTAAGIFSRKDRLLE